MQHQYMSLSLSESVSQSLSGIGFHCDDWRGKTDARYSIPIAISIPMRQCRSIGVVVEAVYPLPFMRYEIVDCFGMQYTNVGYELLLFCRRHGCPVNPAQIEFSLRFPFAKRIWLFIGCPENKWAEARTHLLSFSVAMTQIRRRGRKTAAPRRRVCLIGGVFVELFAAVPTPEVSLRGGRRCRRDTSKLACHARPCGCG